MVAHRFPYFAWAAKMVSSSAGEKGRCSTLGLSWLHHRSRQDFPDRPFMYLLINDQFRGPYRSTSRVRILSSSALHGPLILSGLFPSRAAFPPAENEDSDEDESDDVEEVDELLLNASIEQIETTQEQELKEIETIRIDSFKFVFLGAKMRSRYATWRRGADMPGCRRSFFACSSDQNRTVFVAGGHDEEKNALRSAMAYDVAGDRWVPLPDMAMERDECKGTFHRGKFHVIGGYDTTMQGRFGASAEAFDVSTWQWDVVLEDFLDTATCPRTCVDHDDDDGYLYMCRDNNVIKQTNSSWQVVTQLPTDVSNVAYVTAWQGKMLVIGSSKFSEPHKAFILDLNTYTWTNVNMPENFSGHVQSGCCLEI